MEKKAFEMPSHLFVSDSDGALYDTRVANWNRLPPLRPNYRKSKREIVSVADLKASLRAGQYTDLGGYPLYFITNDGAALAFDSVREELPQVIYSIQNGMNDGWRVVAIDINHEDSELRCDHSGKIIPSAYGDDTSEESNDE